MLERIDFAGDARHFGFEVCNLVANRNLVRFGQRAIKLGAGRFVLLNKLFQLLFTDPNLKVGNRSRHGSLLLNKQRLRTEQLSQLLFHLRHLFLDAADLRLDDRPVDRVQRGVELITGLRVLHQEKIQTLS